MREEEIVCLGLQFRKINTRDISMTFALLSSARSQEGSSSRSFGKAPVVVSNQAAPISK